MTQPDDSSLLRSNMPDGTPYIDLDSKGCIVAVGGTMDVLSGYAKHELEGKPFSIFLTEAYHTFAMELIITLQEGLADEFVRVWAIQTKDKQQRKVLAESFTYEHSNGKVYVRTVFHQPS